MRVLAKATAVFVVSVVIAISLTFTPAMAQDSRTAWLEGTVLDENGNTRGSELVVEAIAPDGKSYGGGPDESVGGLYSIRDIPPGTYEVRLSRDRSVARDKVTAPQRIFGVVLAAGQRTTLNIVTRPGDRIIEIGKPAVVTQTAIVVSEELKRLQKRIDELEKQVASLKNSSQ